MDRFSQRSKGALESYIMSLIEVANRPGMISFATGLPDKRLFDTKGLKDAAVAVLESDQAEQSLQYSVTAGLPSLRKKIANRCKRKGLSVSYENIFLTNGSQECFDHLGRLLIDEGDPVAVENPGYLGALQSFSMYSPTFEGIDLNERGPDIDMLNTVFKKKPKFFYCIPNHQNPSGMTYSSESRKIVAEVADENEVLVIEDDAYGELGFTDETSRAITSYTDNAVFTGSISKIISPGFRIGWMVVPDWMKKKVETSIEASCLHSGSFTQRVLDTYLETHDLDTYLKPIRAEYERKCRLFTDLMKDGMPDSMKWNVPEGGMFVWLKSPEGTDAESIFNRCMEKGLVVMPGKPFHIHGGNNTIRLNYATASDEEIKKGMEILCSVCKELFP